MNQRRLDAECMRDAMLAIGGALDLRAADRLARGGGGRRPDRAAARPGDERGGDRECRRKLSQRLFADRARCAAGRAGGVRFRRAQPRHRARETTNVPSQALYLLNSAFVTAQARRFAERLLALEPPTRLEHAYALAFGRAPDPAEQQASARFFTQFSSNDGSDDKTAWTSFCRALFASAEFRYLN